MSGRRPVDETAQDGAAAIVAQSLSRTFGKVKAVDRVSLSIPKGMIYGFLGPNGSGKTTTIRMLCGLLRPSAGSASVLGMELPRDAERVRPRIGYMTQKFSFYGDLSVRENLDFIARVYSLGRARRRRRIEDNLERYDLVPLMQQRAGTLSGGERQRLALAGVTLHEPELLLLDEPTSAVDPQTRRDFWDNLFELAEAGTTILVSTHFMDEAERCHRLAILARGALVAEGVPRQLAEDIDATILEIETEWPRRARTILRQTPGVLAVTQIGVRLHVMLERGSRAPVEQTGRVLEEAGLTAEVEAVAANLEDVFVAATTFARDAGRSSAEGTAGGSAEGTAGSSAEGTAGSSAEGAMGEVPGGPDTGNTP